jgi:Ser-tRNA(Ala) deacylase AlaX
MTARPATMAIIALTIATLAASATARIHYGELKNTRESLAVAKLEARHAAQQAAEVQEALQREIDARRRLQVELTHTRTMLAEAARNDPEYQEWRNQPLPAAAMEVFTR